jgi:sporulation protein YlmC with PRC-barrel domain
MDLELARDILDQEIVDRNGTNMGRVDGLVMLVGDGGPPRIDRMDLGFVVLARRLHPRLERLVEALRTWSVRKEATYSIPWSRVEAITENAV